VHLSRAAAAREGGSLQSSAVVGGGQRGTTIVPCSVGGGAADAPAAPSSSSSSAAAVDPRTERRRQLWGKLSRVTNIVLVVAVLYVAISSFLTASPQFTARLNDLFNSRAFHRLSSVVSTLPAQNLAALEHQLANHPYRTAAFMTGIAYGLADWTAQTCSGRGPFGFSKTRLLRCTFVGAILLSPIAHTYYHWQDFFIPATLGWWASPVKLLLDQLAYASVYNCIFLVAIGALRLDSPRRIVEDVKRNFKPMMFANWKLWPFVHLLTYTVIPTRFKLLWVDVVEVVWITYLSLVANKRVKETQELVKEVVETAEGGGVSSLVEDTASLGGSSITGSGSSSSFLEQRRARLALGALAERVEALRAAAEERSEAQGRNSDGLSDYETGTGLAGPGWGSGEYYDEDNARDRLESAAEGSGGSGGDRMAAAAGASIAGLRGGIGLTKGRAVHSKLTH
jgi:hypothetical protein